MENLAQNSVYLLKSKMGEEVLALCNLEDYFVDGDEVKLVQFFTQKNIDENNFHEFTKIDYAIYYEEAKKLVVLSPKYKIEKYIGEFTAVVEQIALLSSTENKNQFSSHSSILAPEKIREFLERMINPASNLLS